MRINMCPAGLVDVLGGLVFYNIFPYLFTICEIIALNFSFLLSQEANKTYSTQFGSIPTKLCVLEVPSLLVRALLYFKAMEIGSGYFDGSGSGS